MSTYFYNIKQFETAPVYEVFTFRNRLDAFNCFLPLPVWSEISLSTLTTYRATLNTTNRYSELIVITSNRKYSAPLWTAIVYRISRAVSTLLFFRFPHYYPDATLMFGEYRCVVVHVVVRQLPWTYTSKQNRYIFYCKKNRTRRKKCDTIARRRAHRAGSLQNDSADVR